MCRRSNHTSRVYTQNTRTQGQWLARGAVGISKVWMAPGRDPHDRCRFPLQHVGVVVKSARRRRGHTTLFSLVSIVLQYTLTSLTHSPTPPPSPLSLTPPPLHSCKNFLFESIARADALRRHEARGGGSDEEDGFAFASSDRDSTTTPTTTCRGGDVELGKTSHGGELKKRKSSLARIVKDAEAPLGQFQRGEVLMSDEGALVFSS